MEKDLSLRQIIVGAVKIPWVGESAKDWKEVIDGYKHQMKDLKNSECSLG